jgi:hypothetical protein
MINAQELPKWNFSIKNTEVVLTGFHNGTELLSIKHIDSVNYTFADLHFCSRPDVKANFPGGNDSLKLFIRENLKHVAYNNIFPTVYVAFIVDKIGKILYIGIYRGADDSYNEVALDLIKKMPDWQPAQLKSKNVNSFVVLAVHFSVYQ